ncbi:MAG: hypothetical protein ACHQ2Z_00985 [Elusimicrobiota bacterium]
MAFCGLLLFISGRGRAAESAAEDSAHGSQKYDRWIAQCRAGTLDIRKIRGSDVSLARDAYFAFACQELAAPKSAVKTGDPAVDAQTRHFSQSMQFIYTALSGEKDSAKLCRPDSASQDSELTSLDMKRCELLSSALQQRKSSSAVCESARTMGIGGKDWCGPSATFVDGASNRCDNPKCKEKAALVAAMRSGERAACLASPFCKALSSHDARDCEPYFQRSNHSFCEGVAAEMKKRQAGIRNFTKGQPMKSTSPDVEKRMKAIGGADRTGN